MLENFYFLNFMKTWNKQRRVIRVLINTVPKFCNSVAVKKWNLSKLRKNTRVQICFCRFCYYICENNIRFCKFCYYSCENNTVRLFVTCTCMLSFSHMNIENRVKIVIPSHGIHVISFVYYLSIHNISIQEKYILDIIKLLY